MTWSIGRISPSGALAIYRVPDSYPQSIAVGPEGHLWFPSLHGEGGADRIDSIDSSGNLGGQACVDPACDLGLGGLTAAPDGSLWYGLFQTYVNYGGGGSGLFLAMEAENKAGFVGHLVP